MTHLAQDLRYALRMLGRAPGFAAVVVLTLALGIGANTAIFSLLDQVVLRRLPVPAATELVQLSGPGAFSGRTDLDHAFSYPMYRDLREETPTLRALIARAPASVVFRVGDDSERVTAELVSGNTFVALDATPAIGRFLTPEDDVAGAAPVVVLTDAYWTRRFNRSPTVVGQSVVVNATPMTIIGVARPDFAGMVANQRPAFFTPITLRPFITPTVNDVEDRRSRWLHIVGRLAPGATMARAKAALDVRYRQINDGELTSEPALAALSERFKENFRKKSLDIFDASHGISQVRGALGAPMSMLMAMVGLVLLIACANVANLMLARATGRQREMSVRLALGANRGRLIRQTLVESAVVAVLGGLVGTVMAIWLGDLLLGVLPLDAVDTSLSTTPDGRVALFTCAVTALTVLLFGLAPAVRGSAVDLNRALKEESAAAGGGLQHAHLRKSLVVAQVALSTLLVAGAALFARSLANLETLGPGFDTAHVVTFAVDATLTGRTQVQAKQLYRALGEQLGDLPGVTAVSMAAEAVLTNNASQRTVQVQGYEPGQDENMNPWTNDVGPAYFTALGIPVLAGRQFTERDVDGAPRVAVVNESFAKYYFGNESPLGHRFGFRSEGDPGRWEIVGVVKDTAYSQVRPGEAASLAELAPGRGLPDTTMPRVIYTPYQQSQDVDELTFYLRTPRPRHRACRRWPARRCTGPTRRYRSIA